MSSIRTAISHTFPPKPKYTDKDIPSLAGKIYIVTGANTGVGKELAQILYSKHAKVYIAARSEEKALKAIESIQLAHPKAAGHGELVFLRLDLADLTIIKASAQEFLSKETKLHVLFNNAGVLTARSGMAKTTQGYELHLGTNNIGTFMFTKLLRPILILTAKIEPPGIVRVVWVSSYGAEMIIYVQYLFNLEKSYISPPRIPYLNLTCHICTYENDYYYPFVHAHHML